MITAFPYPTLFGDIDLDVSAVTVDGAPLPYSRISKTERTVALHQAGKEHWSVATLRLDAKIPAEEIDEGPWEDVQCLAVLTERATNTRSVTRLTGFGGGSCHGTVDLARSAHLNRATLSLAVVGTFEGIPGRLIGTTIREWYVDLKSAAPSRQRAIEILQIDFRDGAETWLRPFKDAPWLVDTSGEIPAVLINTSAIEGFTAILNGTGGTAGERALRETMSSQIAQDAWTAMFQAAISDLELDEDGTPQIPGGWRGSVLTSMLPDVFPHLTPTDALYEINQRRTQGFSWSELQTRMQYAAGKRSQVTKRLTTAVRSVSRATESGEQ
ncbi:hypothetical protein [Amycolatopsis nalaikhensis]|uniref:Uncharacterized protein n=1 Tax=Amycolatopsis nalaikhensis TaxID=715472 RepID=A0ABY8XYD2_9PSEU|nr:hypothetical protein [Amycolatopsis sp. 2-2]WIV60603.1 hypothetical protein QP939_19350 [Amycolatopsis sp. 2-2]